MLCFVLAQPKKVEVGGRQEVRGGRRDCVMAVEEMRKFISVQMVSITFRSHFLFEAQVAPPV